MVKKLGLYISCFLFLLAVFPSLASACSCMCACDTCGNGAQYVGEDSSNKCSQPCSSPMSGWSYCGGSGYGSDRRDAVNFTPQIGIPGSQFQANQPYNVNTDQNGTTRAIAEYVKAIYKYLIGIVGIFAAIMLMVGGIVWLTSGGNPEKVKQSQEIIKGSLTGLFLALGSFFILGTINPALVDFRVINIKSVNPSASEADKQRLSQNLDDASKQCPNGQAIGNSSGASCSSVCTDGVISSSAFTLSGSQFLCCVCKNKSGLCFDDVNGNPKPNGTPCVILTGGNGICSDGKCVNNPNCGQSGKLCGQNFNKLNSADSDCCAKCCNGGCKMGSGFMGVYQAVCK